MKKTLATIGAIVLSLLVVMFIASNIICYTALKHDEEPDDSFFYES